VLLGRKQVEAFRHYLALAGAALAVVAAVSLAVEFGTYLPDQHNWVGALLNWIDGALVLFIACLAVTKLYLATNKWEHLLHNRIEWLLLVLFLSEIILSNLLEGQGAVAQALASINTPALIRAYIFIFLGLMAVHWNQRLFLLKLSPALMMVASFASLILLGWILLSLPKCATAHQVSSLDALFTATSAVCVTGLTVLNTGADFTPLGKTILMLLIQAGGLGLMTLAVSFAGFTRRGMGLREKATMRDVLNLNVLGDVGRLMRTILLFTFLCEAAGAALIYFCWPTGMAHISWKSAVFHSVSAFCNAGFSLFPNSLESLSGMAGILMIFAGLFVIGGLGFPVLLELCSVSTWRKPPRRFLKRFTVHTKLVILVTAILIIGGYLGLELLQWRSGSNHISHVDIMFQAMTARTAGFNTVPIASMAPASLLFMALLMYIGASPGSTGGGIKTSTMAILLGSVLAQIKGKQRLEMMGRTIPGRMVQAAMLIGVLSVMVIFTSLLVLRAIEPSTISLQELFFEVVSAFGTVGLSTGITTQLSDVGKAIIMLNMFIGRIGPLTIILALSQNRPASRTQYPDAHVMIG
jgi:trk/ktr system potassium uptake protein